MIYVNIKMNHTKKNRGVKGPAVDIEEIPFSRRVCLRLVNGIFDPLGLISPVTVRLKILMKQHFVVQDKYKKWDTLLDVEDKAEWIKVLRDTLELNSIGFPRHCLDAPYPFVRLKGHFTMICFVDASKDAMCAAVYMRNESPSGYVSVGLLSSKTMVSPAKQETIPRLELCSSLLGCRLVSKVASAIYVGSLALKEVSGKKDLCFSAEYFLMYSRIDFE